MVFNMTVFLLILHGLAALALMGAVTHQLAAVTMSASGDRRSFTSRYQSVSSPVFTNAVMVLYAVTTILGALVYPAYRIDVRIPFEDMQLNWAVGLFELKEHFGGIGLACLPLYSFYWKAGSGDPPQKGRIAITALLAFFVWYDFLVGHVLNNIRGL